MKYERQIDDLQARLKQVDIEMKLCDEIYSKLNGHSFHVRARNFICSVIRQRQRLIDNKASRKNNYEMVTIIDRLKVNLDAALSKDSAMARFFIIHEENIRAIIPGKYPNKRFESFIRLRDEAREIRNRQMSLL